MCIRDRRDRETDRLTDRGSVTASPRAVSPSLSNACTSAPNSCSTHSTPLVRVTRQVTPSHVRRHSS
eukprot:29803-Rhodomonas_salina.1